LGVRPDAYDPLLDVVTSDKLNEILASMAGATAAAVKSAPMHDSYFARGAAVGRAAGAP
jgi:hypothetical protein